jgi:hypothetical protein
MKLIAFALLLFPLLLNAPIASAQTAAGATGVCNDGTSNYTATKRGACSRHGGIKQWFGPASATAPKAVSSPVSAARSRAAQSPVPKAVPGMATAATSRVAQSPTAAMPSGSATGLCNDGTENHTATKRGACSRHGGIKQWYGETSMPVAAKPVAIKPVAVKPMAPPMTPAPVAATRATSTTSARSPSTSATALCNDGTENHTATRQGACSRHGGIKQWYGIASAPAASAPVHPATAPVAPAVARPAVPVAMRNPAAIPAPAPVVTPTRAPQAPAPIVGSSSNRVWANASTKVYHCQGDRWYGNTKKGEYLSEAEAQSRGFHPSRGKTCHP